MAIAVPGQSGLARFIKLPPVERKKIPDIVKYEARQQIPFALEDVVWDYQPLVGSEDEGYAIETEVGLFAMKRDQVARHLKPLEEAGIAVDIIQLAPLAIYNFVCFDRLNVEGAYDPANPPHIDGHHFARHRHDRPGDHQRLSRLAAQHSDRRQSLHQSRSPRSSSSRSPRRST